MRDNTIDVTAEQPFQPEFPISRFARGMVEHEPSPEKMHLGRFSDGQETVEHGPLHRGRFARAKKRSVTRILRSTSAVATARVWSTEKQPGRLQGWRVGPLTPADITVALISDR